MFMLCSLCFRFIFWSCLCPCIAHMLVTDNGFTGSGVSVYRSVQRLLALGTSVRGPNCIICMCVYGMVCACMCVFCPYPAAFGSLDYERYDMSTDDIRLKHNILLSTPAPPPRLFLELPDSPE